MSTFSIAVLAGDGIGPEVMVEALKVLEAVQGAVPELRLEFHEYPAGANEYLRSGTPLPDATFEACRTHDAVLLGAMGMPNVRWPNGTEMAPQLDLREQLNLYAGVRPIKLFHESHTPLKGYSAGDIDCVIFRENTGPVLFTKGRGRGSGGRGQRHPQNFAGDFGETLPGGVSGGSAPARAPGSGG